LPLPIANKVDPYPTQEHLSRKIHPKLTQNPLSLKTSILSKKFISLSLSQHLSSSPSFFISHPSLFHHSWINLHHHRSLPPLLSLPPLPPPPSTDEIQSPSHTIDPLHCKSGFLFYFFVFDLVTLFMNCMIQQTFNKPFLHSVHHRCSSTNLQFGNPFSFLC
jgi:hypothetical protein